MTTHTNLTYIAKRLGDAASVDDAQQVVDLAAALASEQSDDTFCLMDWLDNRTYCWTLLLKAANGDVAALVDVRTEARLPLFS